MIMRMNDGLQKNADKIGKDELVVYYRLAILVESILMFGCPKKGLKIIKSVTA